MVSGSIPVRLRGHGIGTSTHDDNVQMAAREPGADSLACVEGVETEASGSVAFPGNGRAPVARTEVGVARGCEIFRPAKR